jgi:hypothetical protein
MGYSGADPQFKATIVALDNSTSTYTQYLTCSFPLYVANPQGFYFFSCTFKGYGMASTVKLVIMQLSWKNMPVGATINFNMYIAAGTCSHFIITTIISNRLAELCLLSIKLLCFLL